MLIKEPTNKIPRPTLEASRALIRARAPSGFTIPKWLENLVIIAYQNGRYDEASSETFNAAFY